MRLFLEGVPQKEICRLTGRSKSAVTRAVKAYKENEGRIVDAPRSGRPRATDEAADHLIIAAAVDDPYLTAQEIKEELGLNVSCDTIRRRLKEAGLKNCVAVQKPYLTDKQRRQRFEFARAYEHWAFDDWGQVIFTDESTFSTRWDQQQRVWRPVNCRYGSNRRLRHNFVNM